MHWNSGWRLCLTLATLGVIAAGIASPAAAEFFINEIFFNVGGGGSDLEDEYIELRGTPDTFGTSMSNHYLLILENELNADGTGNAGLVENIFDLSSFSMGSNGFLTLRQKGSLYPVAPGTSDHVNSVATSLGWGSGVTGPLASSVGASGVNNSLQLEGGGFTAMLIRNDSGPVPTAAAMMDLDSVVDNDGNPATLNDGLDYPGLGQPGWTILDSIGVFAEPDETETGRLYAPVNFGVRYQEFEFPPNFEPNLEPGAQFELVDFYEIEFVGRWGNSTGQTIADWHVSNFTDDTGAGSAGVPDWRQSCVDPEVGVSCHPTSDSNPNTPAPQVGPTESSQAVPYGTKLANTLGAPNYITGDFNKDGVVDAADYTVWRDSLGATTGTETNHPAADANHDFLVNDLDYDLWKSNFGRPGSGAGAGGSAVAGAGVPEPATVLLLAIGGAIASIVRRRSRRSFKRRIA